MFCKIYFYSSLYLNKALLFHCNLGIIKNSNEGACNVSYVLYMYVDYVSDNCDRIERRFWNIRQ